MEAEVPTVRVGATPTGLTAPPLTAPTAPKKILKAGCPSCRPTNSVIALKALYQELPEKTKYEMRQSDAEKA